MIVIAILGFSMALIAFANPFGSTALTDRAAVSSLLAGLRQARAMAIVKQRPIELVIDVKARSFQLAQARQKPTPLPQRVGISVLTAAGETLGDTIAAIRFLPDGSSTGGKIDLVDGHWRSEITINWLTGRISTDHEL